MAITWGYNKDHRPDLEQLLFILTVARDGAIPVYFQVASGNVVDDKTHIATWDLLCRLVGGPDFLYVADCKLASTENMTYIHQHQGRFLTVLPRTRSEDKAFRDLLAKGQVQWRHIHDKRNDKGEIVDQYSVAEPATLSNESYRLMWYHSTCKAQQDAYSRQQQIERATNELAELRQKLLSPRTRYRQEAKVVEAVQEILRNHSVDDWIITEITEQTEEKYRQHGPGRPNEHTRYVKETSTRFKLEYRINTEQLALDAWVTASSP
jgi:transposase